MPLQVSEVNEQISHLSKVFSKIVLERSLLESKLFPVNAYICVGFYQCYDRLYGTIKQVWDRITPEELAKRSKTLLSPVQALSISYLWLYYSLARMGEIHNKYGSDPAKEPADKREQWKYMLENWHRLATSYFDSGKPTVASSGWANRAFDDKSIEWLKDNLQPATLDQVNKSKRAIGLVDLYAFLDECEARAKIVDHGPYPLGNDEVMVVSEYTNLYDGRGRLWLPWSATESKLPSSSLGVAMVLKGAKVAVNDIGTKTIDPADYAKHVTRMVAYTRSGDKVSPVGIDELQAYGQAAENAQMELYMRFAEMDRKQLLLAGAEAYWRGFARFTDQVGITESIDWKISQGVQDEHLEYFMSHNEDPAFARLKMKIIKSKALFFLKEKDPVLYLLPGSGSGSEPGP